MVRGYILGAAIDSGRRDPEQWLSYSRNHNYYANSARKRYWPVNNMYAGVVSSVDQLAGLGLIEHQKVPPGNLHWQSRFRAMPELLRLFAEKNIPLMLAPPERIQLRDKDGRLIEYGDTEQIRRWRRRLETFNEVASALTVSLDGCVIREGEPLVTPKNRIGASTVTMFRVFSRTFKMGGRFYGPWVQNIEKELRGRIQINGCPTDEPDYREHHSWLLYNALGRQMPAEPFILGGWDRKIVKAAFYTLLNAESPIAARRAIAEDLGRGREGYAKAGKLIADLERKHYCGRRSVRHRRRSLAHTQGFGNHRAHPGQAYPGRRLRSADSRLLPCATSNSGKNQGNNGRRTRKSDPKIDRRQRGNFVSPSY